jgi:3-oxoadipate enol-lactonase
MGPIVDQVVDRYLTREFQDANPSAATVVRDTLVRTPRVGYQEACRAVMNVDFMEVLGSIKTPTLVIAGDKDIATPVASCAQIASLIPNARFEVIGGASHLSSVEQSDEFLRLTEAFVADLTTDSRASNGG